MPWFLNIKIVFRNQNNAFKIKNSACKNLKKALKSLQWALFLPATPCLFKNPDETLLIYAKLQKELLTFYFYGNIREK